MRLLNKLREATKKSFFISGPSTKPPSPPPLELSGHRNDFDKTKFPNFRTKRTKFLSKHCNKTAKNYCDFANRHHNLTGS